MASSLPQTKEEADTLPDAWDYKGRAAVRSSSGGWTTAAMILGNHHLQLIIIITVDLFKRFLDR